LKSTLEAFLESVKREKKKGNFGTTEQESKEMDLISKFITDDKELYKQISQNASQTIKTIQPSILFKDFLIAMAMETAIVCNAIHYLAKKGHIKIDGVSVEEKKDK